MNLTGNACGISKELHKICSVCGQGAKRGGNFEFFFLFETVFDAMDLDTNTLLIGGAIAIFVVALLLLRGGGAPKKTEPKRNLAVPKRTFQSPTINSCSWFLENPLEELYL